MSLHSRTGQSESALALAPRLARLEARAAIRDAKTQSVFAVDQAVSAGGDSAAVRQYVTDGYRWSASAFGTFEGVEAYIDFVGAMSHRLTYSVHFLSGPAIELDLEAGTATGKWAVWQPLTREGESWILMGHTVDQFIRHEQRWLLDRTDLDVEVLAPWGTGWGAEPIAARWRW